MFHSSAPVAFNYYHRAISQRNPRSSLSEWNRIGVRCDSNLSEMIWAQFSIGTQHEKIKQQHSSKIAHAHQKRV
jgi:hypothetical protein